MTWYHWVAKAWAPRQPFFHYESASWFWRRLGRVFPELVSAVLMPDHCHLILPKGVEVNRKLGGLLASTSVRNQEKMLWQPIPEAKEIPNSQHLRRHIRYLALNPCRDKLCKDPLEWHWSTYREVMGATADFVQTPESWALLMKDRPSNFRVRFHAYVSGDPSVSITGTPFPKPVTPPSHFPNQSIGEILEAAAAALRVRPNEVRRNAALRALFVHSAYRHGWRRPSELAQICGMTRAGVHKILERSPPPGIHAADLCLGDPRLKIKD